MSVALVEQALAAIRAGDLEAARPLVADDFIWHIPGASPISGDAVGLDAWAEKFQQIVARGLRPEILDTFESGDHVVFLQRNTATIGDHSLDVRVLNLFTVGDGKLQRMDTFFSEQRDLEAFWTAVGLDG